MKSFSKRCFAAAWFGVAAYLSAMLATLPFILLSGSKIILINQFTIPALVLGLLAGFFIGYRLLQMKKSPKALRRVLAIGALTPLVALVIIIHLYVGFIFWLTLHSCAGSTAASCVHPLQGASSLYFVSLATGLMLYSWSPVGIGMLSSWLFYRFFSQGQ